MSVNEKEAKTMWCPWVRERGGSNIDSACIASECMMWRWTVPGSKEKFDRVKTPLIGEEADRARSSGYRIVKEDNNWIYWERKVSNHKEGEGYCGLAGNPVATAQQFVPVGNIAETTRPTRSAPQPQQTGQVMLDPTGSEIDLDIVKALAGKDK